MSADDPILPGEGEPEAEPSQPAGEDEAPPPATWAGRTRFAGGDPSSGTEHAPGADDGDPGGERGVAGDRPVSERSGFTDDIEQVERELSASIEEEPESKPRDIDEEGLFDDDDDLELGGDEDSAGGEAAEQVGAEARAAGETETDAPAAADVGEPRDEGEPAEVEDESAADEDELEPDGEGRRPGDGEPEGAGPGSVAPEREAVASEETVEADTLALADREAAEEAALAGLRARASRQASKRESGTPSPATPAGPATATAADGAPSATPTAAAEEAPRARALWARFLAASLVIVISIATATSVTLLLILEDLASGIGGITDVERELTPVGGGEPQTILILGSDQRLGIEGGDEDGARSDTAILLRVDPDRESIGLLSIPRDLRVNIPGVGVDKFNAAYAHGGPKLALRVVKQLTGLDVNHVVNINFTGFAEAVNAIDCVFIDVDRRYFIPPETGIAEIDIEAGYQRLCGLKALQYVRFRHDDNDLVRAARQQDFLREARQKIPPSTLFSQRYELLDIFKEYTTSSESLADPIQLLELLKTFLAARKAPVNEVHFPARLGGPDDPYVTANRREIRRTVRQFLGAEGTPGPKPGSTEPDEPARRGRQGERERGGGRQRDERPESGPSMVEAPIVRDHAQRVADETTPSGRRLILDFPVSHPAEVPARTNLNPLEASRAFSIDGPGDEVYHGYKLVFGIPGMAGFTEYWGVSGTNWRNPPILENPSETDGRFLKFYDGDRLRLVGWKQRRTSYWVSNTLLQSLNEDEMMAIARSMRRLGE